MAEDRKFPDDEWRQILEANGFTPSGAVEEVWRSPYSDLKVRIDVNRETEEPYYQIITEDGTRLAQETDPEALKDVLTPKEPEPLRLSPEEEKAADKAFLKSVGISHEAGKRAGKPPRFSFAVPIRAGGNVAYQLAKAGLGDFEAVNYKDDEITEFMFKSEPEMHIGEEIVKQEFADQIAHHSAWRMWQPRPQDPSQVKGEKELNPPRRYVSSVEKAAALARAQGKFAGQWGERSYDSDKVHDILDKHRSGGKNLSFDSPVPEAELPALLAELEASSDDGEVYLGVIVFLVTHGSKVPSLYRERARQIAFNLVQDEAYLQEWTDPKDRKIELENEIELLEGGGKTAADQAERYRRKKLLQWIEYLGLDLSDLFKKYDEGDFWAKDKVYEEVREMVKEQRKFDSYYRRKMLGR